MEQKEIVKKLKSLCQLDIDAMHAYKQAKDHIEQVDINNNIIQFQADHGRHVQDLSEVIRSYGEQPPEFSKDFKGFLLEAFAAMRSATGTEGALKALRGGEKMTNKQYGEAVKWDWPPNIMSLIQQNYNDEQRHLSYIEQCLSDRAWTKKAA